MFPDFKKNCNPVRIGTKAGPLVYAKPTRVKQFPCFQTFLCEPFPTWEKVQ